MERIRACQQLFKQNQMCADFFPTAIKSVSPALAQQSRNISILNAVVVSVVQQTIN